MKNSAATERELQNLQNQIQPIKAILDNPDISDVMANTSGRIYIHQNGTTQRTETVLSASDRRILIYLCASMSGQTMDEDHPDYDGILPIPGIQARISATIPPWTDQPTFCIRKLSQVVIQLGDYQRTKRASKEQIERIIQGAMTKKNILISGGTGSGKTTLAKAIIHALLEYNPETRLYIVEDTQEINCTSDNSISLRVDPGEAARAVAKALRYFPDRIIFGEVRYGAVLLELLKAWNTGHPGGLTTVHADSAESTYSRAENLLAEVVIDAEHRKKLLYETLGMVIHLSRGGKIEKIMEGNP